jgi:hypothetical protein
MKSADNSYVGIRGDENREGYISKKENIQSIFSARKHLEQDAIKKSLQILTQISLHQSKYRFQISQSIIDTRHAKQIHFDVFQY